MEMMPAPFTESQDSVKSQIHFKNQPLLSEHEAQREFNERRLNLLPQVEELITTSELFTGQQVTGEFAQTGVSSLVCFLDTEDQRYVLKVPLSYTDGNGEADFLKTWEDAGVTVPHIYENGQLGDHPYLIMEYIDAPSLQSKVKSHEVPEGAWLEMGETLVRMHTPTTEGYGRIVSGKPEFDTFGDWLLGAGIEKRIATVRELNLLDDKHGRLNRVFGELLAYAQEKPNSTLCHFDFTPNNILATQPLTVFDPSPMLNHGIIDIGRSMISCIIHNQLREAEELKQGYFGDEAYNTRALQASIILNAYWKIPYLFKTNRHEDIAALREYLDRTVGEL